MSFDGKDYTEACPMAVKTWTDVGTMHHTPLVTAMVAAANFSPKVDSCGFAYDGFNFD
jgi:hypothetical protein